MKNKKGQMVIAIIALVILAAGVGTFIWFATTGGGTTSQTAVVAQTAQAIAQGKSGDVSSIGIFVRNLADDDVNTKIVVPVYCMGDDGTFIIDGTQSSAVEEITGKSTVGSTVTCYAFNSTVQTIEPVVVQIDAEVEHIVIDAFIVSIDGVIDFFDDTFTVADLGVSNLTITSPGSDTYQKAKFTNNVSDKMLPLAGFYIDVIEDTNMSRIDITGSASVGGISGKTSTNIVESSLPTKVTTRKSRWDFVFEIDDGNPVPGNAGLQPILLDENDFIETSIVIVESDTAGGCETGADFATTYAFTKGYYREAQNTGVAYGHETDAVSGAVITADITLEHFACED